MEENVNDSLKDMNTRSYNSHVSSAGSEWERLLQNSKAATAYSTPTN